MPAQQNANSGVPRGSASTGARHYLTANGRVVGYVQGVNWNAAINQLDVEVLDNALTEEHVLGGVTYSGTAQLVKVVGKSLINAGVTTPLEDVLTSGDLGFAMVDRPTGRVIRSWSRIALTGLSEDFRKGALTVTTVNFKCIRVMDEDGLTEA